MAHPDSSGWLLKYSDSRSDARVLVSLPSAMLRDLRLLAKSQNISVAELIRRAATREVAAHIKARPEIAASFKGTVCGEH